MSSTRVLVREKNAHHAKLGVDIKQESLCFRFFVPVIVLVESYCSSHAFHTEADGTSSGFPVPKEPGQVVDAGENLAISVLGKVIHEKLLA